MMGTYEMKKMTGLKKDQKSVPFDFGTLFWGGWPY